MLCSHDGSVVVYEHALYTARRRTRQYRTMARARVRVRRYGYVWAYTQLTTSPFFYCALPALWNLLQAFLREARERGHFSPNCYRHGACAAQNVQGIDLRRAGRWSSGEWRKYRYLRKEEAQP